MNDVTFNILKIVISAATAIIALYLVPYLKNKLADERYAQLLAIVEVAVHAAEQTIGNGHGSVKKDEVVRFVSEWMATNGINISDEQLNQLIEAAVFTMNKELK